MARVKEVKVNFSGMVTAPGELSRPQASMSYVENAHIEAPGIIKKRVGWLNLPERIPQIALSVYNDILTGDVSLVHAGPDNLTADTLYWGDGFTSWNPVSIVPLTNLGPDQAITRTREERMQFSRGTHNIYATASQGVLRIDNFNDPAVDQLFAGIPRGMAPWIWYAAAWQGIDVLTGSPGTLLNEGFGRAYRVTWHYVDTNGTEIGGAPTGRVEVENITDYPGHDGSPKDVHLVIPLPYQYNTLNTQISTRWICRIWGTRVYNTAQVAGVNTQDDEMFLVAEKYPSAQEVAQAYMEFIDRTPDAFITGRQYLHTNTTFLSPGEAGEGVGVLNEDAPPPTARAMAFWRNRMWYGNVEYHSRLSVKMVSVPNNGDVVFITNPDSTTTAYMAQNSPASPTEFQRYTGFPTLMENIRATAQALCDAINQQRIGSATGVCAFYTSTSLSNAGNIYLENNVPFFGPTGTGILLTCSNPVVFDPTNSGTAVGSTDPQRNGIAFSKSDRPDSCPPSFTMFVGGRQEVILKMAALRERLFVFTDTAIHVIEGYTPADFVVRKFANYRVVAPESVVQCDDRLFAWCKEGIIEISEAGVEIISLPIDQTIQDFLSAMGTGAIPSGIGGGFDALSKMGFAVSSETFHKVLFWRPFRNYGGRTGCGSFLAWDTRTRTWSNNVIGGGGNYRSAGIARASDGAIILVQGTDGTTGTSYYFVERTSRESDSDFIDSQDDGSGVSISTILEFQFDVPVIDGAVHWQQAVLQFQGRELIRYSYPLQIALGYLTDFMNNPVPVTVNYSMDGESPLIRVETPMAVRRSNRMQVTITHNQIQPFQLVGFSISARIGSTFARRTNNI